MFEIDEAAFRARAYELADRVSMEGDTTILSMMRPRVVACDPTEPGITLAFPAMAWEQNAGGVIHGGITAAMMDSVMGVLAYAISGGMCPTMNLNISYPRPAPGDGTLIARARAVRVGHTSLYMTAELWDERAPDKQIVIANGVFHDLHQPLRKPVSTAETLDK